MNTVVFLVYISILSSGVTVERYSTMPDMDSCLKSVANARVEVPNGGDSETTVTLYCTKGRPVIIGRNI